MNHSVDAARKPFIHVRPKKGWQLLDLNELKGYRDLFYFLVVRDIKVRYKQTVLGGLWQSFSPFFNGSIFFVFR